MDNLVSVIIPAYNRAKLISESILSVLDQTHSDLEVIVVDDGSTDNTREIVCNIADERIRCVTIGHCGLIGKVRNEGIKLARGQFIAFQDSDDLWNSRKLEIQLSLLQENSDSHFCLSNGTQFGEGAVQPPEVATLKGNLFRSFLFEHAFPLYIPSLIVRKNVFDSVGLLNETYQSVADVDFCYRILSSHAGIFTNIRLVSIRKHSQNHSDAHHNVSFRELTVVFDQLLSQKHITKKQHRHLRTGLLYNFAVNELRRSNNKSALDTFIKCALQDPLHMKSWARIAEASVKILAR